MIDVIYPPKPEQHDLPYRHGGYGSTNYPDYTVIRCTHCNKWFYSAPCYESFGPVSTWKTVKWFQFNLKKRIKQ